MSRLHPLPVAPLSLLREMTSFQTLSAPAARLHRGFCETRSADGHDVCKRRGLVRTGARGIRRIGFAVVVTGVAGTCDEHDARMNERGIARRVLWAAVRVADDVGFQPNRGIHRRVEPVVRVARFNKQNVAFRADRGDHVEVERFFAGPTRIFCRQRRCQTVLIDLAETSVGRGARRKSERRTIHGEIGFGLGIVVRVDDRDRLIVPAAGR